MTDCSVQLDSKSECDHHSHSASDQTRRLSVTMSLVFIYFLAELFGGLWTGSLALLADAGHMFSDMTALAISLFAAWMVSRTSTAQQTFGHLRAEILAAAFNGSLLFLVAGGIMHEAWERFMDPQPILGGPMLWIAIGGLVVNLISLKVLHGGHTHDLNMRGAWLHVMGDTLGSVAVILAAVLIYFFQWNWVDPLISVIVCLLILVSSWNLVREAIRVLMEYAPNDIDVSDIESHLQSLSNIHGVHCLHVWTISSGLTALSAHVVVDSQCSHREMLREITELLKSRYRIHHLTLQIESVDDPICSESSLVDCTTNGRSNGN
ncbi:cation diffusion facilitator family transporter [Thalassoglobus sp. JC818]|uniref:cation diffusion facilitator family transporter n=1 Tax=Thalassoglobus sp. JC818 TaxID=3232136 RepID=UPI003459185E